jgi:RNA polymerase sigma-70 factor (ECF subfamily)
MRNATLLGGTSEDLVRSARDGDRDAFASLIEERFDRVFRTASAILGNDADARDIVQEAFLKAWQSLPRLRDPARFDGWFNQMLRNRCRDALRQRRRSRETPFGLDDPPAPDVIGDVAGTADLNAAFERLSADHRQILVMHHLHDMPLRDLARQLGIPVGTAKWRLFRARRALIGALEDPS